MEKLYTRDEEGILKSINYVLGKKNELSLIQDFLFFRERVELSLISKNTQKNMKDFIKIKINKIQFLKIENNLNGYIPYLYY